MVVRLFLPMVAAGAALVPVVLGAPVSAVDDPGPGSAAAGSSTSLVSRAFDGGFADGQSLRPEVTPDGRYVAYQSHAKNLLTGGGNVSGDGDVFVTDRETGTTVWVSRPAIGQATTGESQCASISADGRFVAYRSDSRLTPTDDNSVPDVYLWDRQSNESVVVSHARSGRAAGVGRLLDYYCSPAMSADGRYVTYTSPSKSIVPGNTTGGFNVYLWDRVNDRTRLVSSRPDGAFVDDGDSYESDSSEDGRWVTYTSSSDQIVPGSEVTKDVFLWDRTTGSSVLVSRDASGGPIHATTVHPSISPGGRFVAYEGTGRQVFLWDRMTDATTAVSSSTTGGPFGGRSFDAEVGRNGRFVAFTSYGPQLDEDTNEAADIYVWQRGTGTTRLVSRGFDGSQANSDSYQPSLADGGSLAFISYANNIVPGDGTNGYDIFYWSRNRG